jgi:hypothetical protein
MQISGSMLRPSRDGLSYNPVATTALRVSYPPNSALERAGKRPVGHFGHDYSSSTCRLLWARCILHAHDQVAFECIIVGFEYAACIVISYQ